MIKYASNALLATAISFSNELANLCAALGGVDVVEVMEGVHLSRYLTIPPRRRPVTAPLTSFLEAGLRLRRQLPAEGRERPGGRGREVGSPMPLLEAVAAVNDGQPARWSSCSAGALARWPAPRRASWGSPSSPAPTTSGRRRRSRCCGY